MKQNIKNVYLVSLVLIIIDQFIKAVVSYKMHLYDSYTLIRDFLDINLVHNTGAAFSLLQGGRVFLVMVAVLVVALVTVYIYSSEYVDDGKIFIYGLLLGGIIGNLIDRIVRGYVVDYISFTIFNYKFPVFNFADICIVFAVILVVVGTIKEGLWK